VSNKAIGELVITEAAMRKHVGRSSPSMTCPPATTPSAGSLAVLVYLSRQRQAESIGM
jgi:hypothetical protein